jgi:hypothetical protein
MNLRLIGRAVIDPTNAGEDPRLTPYTLYLYSPLVSVSQKSA